MARARCAAIAAAGRSVSEVVITPAERSPPATRRPSPWRRSRGAVPISSATPTTWVTRAPASSRPRASTRDGADAALDVRRAEHRQPGGEPVAACRRLARR